MTPRELPTIVLLWLLAFGIVEALLTGLLWSGRVAIAWLAAVHLVTASFAAWTAWKVDALRRNRTVWLAVVTASGTGLLGVAGAGLSAGVSWALRHQHHTIDQWYEQLFPRFAPDAHAALWRRVGQRASDRRQPTDVIPFLDLLQHGSLAQKQSVISLISTSFRPAFAGALRAALTDSQNVIRVQAATAIARLENQFLEDTLRLEACAKDTPDDVAALMALAAHYDDYAFTGLLDSGRERDCRDKATALYERARTLAPSDEALATRLGRLYLRLGRFADAERVLREVVPSAHGHEARLWLMECLFRQRRYGDLRTLAQSTPDEADNLAAWPVEVAPTIKLWLSRTAEAEEAA